MKTESLKELINLCIAGQCSVKLEACQTGIVANITATRGHVNLQTSIYLDRNDAEIAEKLETAIQRVQ